MFHDQIFRSMLALQFRCKPLHPCSLAIFQREATVLALCFTWMKKKLISKRSALKGKNLLLREQVLTNREGQQK